MSSSTVSTARFDSIVFEFLDKHKGALVVATEDIFFLKMLRSIVTKTLGIKRDPVHTTDDRQKAAKIIKGLFRKKIPVLFFLEAQLGGRPTADFIAGLKPLYPDIKIIALVAETRREQIVYLYESGADNVISKPASVNNIIEKMAFTVQPQGKLSALVDTAMSHLDKGDLVKALALSDKILEIKPGSAIGLMLRGDVYVRQGRDDEAVEAYQEAHQNAKMYLKPLKRLADVHKERNEDDYLEVLKQLDRLSPLNADRKSEIGKVHVKKGEMKLAEKYFDQAIECATREAQDLIGAVAGNIAEALHGVSDAMAEKYLTQSLAAKGNNLSTADLHIFNRLGITLRRQGKWKEAIENYRRALTVAPRDEALYYNMGLAFMDGDRPGEAVNQFEQAMRINPRLCQGNENVCVNVANAYFALGRHKDAQTYYERALAINPSNAEARERMRKKK